MTPQDWKEVEEKLKSFYDHVKLNCDGYEVTFILRRLSQFKNAIQMYVNGYMKGVWILEDCEERRRFIRPIKRYLHSPKGRARLKKFPKRWRKESKLLDPDAVVVGYLPYWTSFKSLKSHLIKNNQSITLIREKEE